MLSAMCAVSPPAQQVSANTRDQKASLSNRPASTGSAAIRFPVPTSSACINGAKSCPRARAMNSRTSARSPGTSTSPIKRALTARMSKGAAPNDPEPATHTDGGVDSSRGYTLANCISKDHKPWEKWVESPGDFRTSQSKRPCGASAPTSSTPKTSPTISQQSAMVASSSMPTHRYTTSSETRPTRTSSVAPARRSVRRITGARWSER